MSLDCDNDFSGIWINREQALFNTQSVIRSGCTINRGFNSVLTGVLARFTSQSDPLQGILGSVNFEKALDRILQLRIFFTIGLGGVSHRQYGRLRRNHKVSVRDIKDHVRIVIRSIHEILRINAHGISLRVSPRDKRVALIVHKIQGIGIIIGCHLKALHIPRYPWIP